MAHDGQEALAVAREFRPGRRAAGHRPAGHERLRGGARPAQQPESQQALLIALTGYGEAESRSRSAQAGFDFHMVKPADVNLLLAMLADPQEARKAAVTA